MEGLGCSGKENEVEGAIDKESLENTPPSELVGAGGLPLWHIVERCGHRIGLIGVIERDWVETFKHLDVELIYMNYKRSSQKLARHLKQDHKCDIVIALAHMRIPHDRTLAK